MRCERIPSAGHDVASGSTVLLTPARISATLEQCCRYEDDSCLHGRIHRERYLGITCKAGALKTAWKEISAGKPPGELRHKHHSACCGMLIRIHASVETQQHCGNNNSTETRNPEMPCSGCHARSPRKIGCVGAFSCRQLWARTRRWGVPSRMRRG